MKGIKLILEWASCSNCPWFKPKSSGPTGTCRVNPPALTSVSGLRGIQPEVAADGICSQHPGFNESEAQQ